MLQKIVQQVLTTEQEVRTVLVLNSKGQVLALSGPELSVDLIDKIKQQNNQELRLDRGIIFTSPIYRSLVEIDDFESANASTSESAESAKK